MKVSHYNVNEKGEWAEFFVSERDPVCRGTHVRYSATFACNSSYGAFAHYWHDMGEPFAKFVAGIGDDYLLSKIGSRVASAKVVEKSVKAEILRTRRDRYRRSRKSGDRNDWNAVEKAEAREAWNAVEEIVAEGHSGEVTAMKLYEDDDICKVVTEWTEIATTDWDACSRQFVRKIWPAFVALLKTKEG